METCTKLIKHISQKRLKKLVRKERNLRIKERLLFINQLYLGASIPEACKRLCTSNQTGYEWLKEWNEKGCKELKPNFNGGRKTKLTEEQKEKLKQTLKSKTAWTTQEARALIRKEFGTTYSLRHTSRLLRSFGMVCTKPYIIDYRKPYNAEELLKESIKEAVKELPKDTVIGFIDETMLWTNDNRQRVWSFGKPVVKKNTTKYKANTFGFYPVNGKEVVEFKENSRIADFKGFLRKVMDKNPAKYVLVFADKFATHMAKDVIEFAKSMGITFVFLPKYSPNLNPLEFIWKSIRRIISKIGVIKSEWALKESIRTAFHRLARRKSFMKSWLEKFGPRLF